MKIALICYHFEDRGTFRPNLTRQALVEMSGVEEVVVYTSDFEHYKKKKKVSIENGVVQIPVRPYKKNISLARILSYRDFQIGIEKRMELARFDLLLVEVPDYVSAASVVRSKRRLGCCVIIDVVDLWPEAFPTPRVVDIILKRPLRPCFRYMRTCVFAGADRILAQSRHLLAHFGRADQRGHFLPMCSTAERAIAEREAPSIQAQLNLLYLGSVNSIIDVDSLVFFLRYLSARRRVRLAVIGGGEGLERLKSRIKLLSIETKFYGITFDRNIKREEYKTAHFGYNGYRLTTEVAVSYKSIEYLESRIPLINSARGDTHALVANLRCGFNFSESSLANVAEKILRLSCAEYQAMAYAAGEAFNKNFSYGTFRTELQRHVGETITLHRRKTLETWKPQS